MVLANLGWLALMLGSLIVVHEFGHLVVAKLCGVKVEKFSVGFGRKLISFTRGETEYQLALIPLGGYVKMAGAVPGEEISPEDEKRGFLTQAPWKRALISFAGPASNVIFPIFLGLAVFVGWPQTSTRVMSVTAGLPPAMAGLQVGDRVLAVNGNPVESEAGLAWRLEGKRWDDVVLTVDRAGVSKELRLHAGETLLGESIPMVRPGLVGFSAVPEPVQVGVLAGSPGAAAGLKTFDRMLSVNGTPVVDRQALEAALHAAGSATTVQVEVARFSPARMPGAEMQTFERVVFTVPLQPGGRGLAALGADSADLFIGNVAPGSVAEKAGVEVGDRLLQVNGKDVPSFAQFMFTLESLGSKSFQLSFQHGAERRTVPLTRMAVEVQGQYGQKEQRLQIGIGAFLGDIGERPHSDKVHLGIGAAFMDSLHSVESMTAQMATGIGMLVTGRTSLDNGGSVGTLYLVAARSAEQGFDTFLLTMAFVSINLGLVNLFPIPALDGFTLLSAFWEAVRRRPMSNRVREVATMIGIALLLMLMARFLFNDVRRLL